MPEPSSPLRGPSASRATVPPNSTPSRASFDAFDANVDRPARIQMIVALILGLVLVAIPLYLWRRPRTESIQASIGFTDAGALPPVTTGSPAATTPDGVQLADPRIVSCHDPGPKKTPPEQCDHVPEIEKPFAQAIQDSAACVAKTDGGGTIVYLLDVTLKAKKLDVKTPRDGRSLKNPKVATACEKAVKAKLATTIGYDAPKHDHARYRVSITATYPGSVK